MKSGRARTFVRGVKKLVERVESATAQWTKDPTVRNTHWLRTSLRRMDAAIELLPKDVRKASRTRRFRKHCRSLFSTIATLRDDDVMSERIGRALDQPDTTPARRTHRLATIADALPLADALLSSKPPRLPEHDLDLQARFAKIVARHADRLRRNLPPAVADPTCLDELHDARKAAKHLRYAYELGGEDLQGRRLAWIIALQDLLGDLHDRDVLIAMLQSLEDFPNSRPLRRLLDDARHQRRRKHAELATWLQRTPTLIDVVAPLDESV